MKKSQISVVLVPVGLGFVLLPFGGIAFAAAPPSVAVKIAKATSAKAVANCCHDHMNGAFAKRDGETRAQCGPQVAEVEQGGGPERPEPAGSATLHQTANTAKPGR